MKRLIFTLIFASLLGGYAFAYDFSAMCESGQTLYYNITSSTEPYTVEVTREYTSSPYYTTYPTGNLTIPSSVTYNSITYSVTSIGYCAFNNCSGLTSVTIPYYVTSIGGSAFGRCYGLTSVNFNATNCAAMGDYSSPVFYGCSSLATLNIGGNVTNIPDYAFYDCSSLNAVYYMGTVEQWCGITFGNYGAQPLIYAHNLYVNSSLVTDLVIPETVTEIKERAFCGATCLTSVTIGNSVASIGNYAFSGCSGLTGELTIPNSVTSIGAYAFYGCNGLATINFNAINCTSMSEYEPAFEGCTSVTILNIGENVTNIPAYAFRGFSGVTGELTIPNSVTSIGDYAFYGFSGVTGELTLPNSVTSIGEYAFYGCSRLTGTLTIPNSVTSIGSSAFSGCNGLTTLNFNAENCTNGGYLFGSNNTLSKITIGENVATIPNNAFKNCTSLDSIISYAVNPPVIYASTFDSQLSLNTPVVVPCGMVEAYEDADFWYNFRRIQQREDCGVTYTITVMSANPNRGTVTGGGTYPEGTVITIEATALDGFVFASWSDENTENPRQITVTGNATYIASFDEVSTVPEYTITVMSANPNRGTVTGGGTYPEGTIVRIEANALDGFVFTSWSDDNTDNPRYITVTENATYIASFDPATGIEENVALEINVFPNPATDILNITSSETISEIDIVNVIGQVVKRIEINSDNAVCDVKDLKAGVYVVRIRTLRQAQWAALRKFIKE